LPKPGGASVGGQRPPTRSYVLDTNVAAAWYLPEEFTPAARKWQQEMLEERIALIAPSLHLQEFANVLRTYVVRGEIGEDLAWDITSRFSPQRERPYRGLSNSVL
jgi:predicted nucleic acid-binding protein